MERLKNIYSYSNITYDQSNFGKRPLFLKIQAVRTISEFPFFFGLSVYRLFVVYLSKRSPRIRTENFKNFVSIVTIVNYRKRQDAQSPLSR